MIERINLNQAAELLDDPVRKALEQDLSDVDLETSENNEDLRSAYSSASILSSQHDMDDDLFDPLYYRIIPELDMHLKTLDSASGAHTATFVDIDEEYLVQIPKESTPEERRQQRDARLDHYQTYLDEGIPVTGEWDGGVTYVDGEEMPFLIGDYNPNLEEIESLDGEKRQMADAQAEQIGEKVLELMDEGRVSYKDNGWQQANYGHRAWDSERETVVVDDLGEYIE